MRGGYQDLAAKGLLTFEELGEKLAALEETRGLARRELEALKGKRERLEDLKRDRDAVLEAYANVTAEALEELSAEERNKLYKILKLRVVVRDDGTQEVSGVFCGGLGIPEAETFAEGNDVAGGVVHVDAQLDACQVQPVVRQVKHRLHERRPHALALPVVAHGHPDAADVPHAQAGGGGLQADASDHLSFHTGHQRVQSLGWLREPPAPGFRRWEGQLQGARDGLRSAEDAVQGLVVPWLRVANTHLRHTTRPPVTLSFAHLIPNTEPPQRLFGDSGRSHSNTEDTLRLCY
jgi:hypothetical protein